MTRNRFWIGTSWKMNKTLREAQLFCAGLRAGAHTLNQDIQGFVLPPYTAMREVKQQLSDIPIRVGAQNMHWNDSGAWTGEISAPMLLDCGADMVELGHSERREHFAETNETVALKVAAAILHGLQPLICIGETLAEKNGGRADAVLEQQVRGALAHINPLDTDVPILFAYEPVWAIGEHGVPASADYADARHAHIVDVAKECGLQSVQCLYGGSVNLENCAELSNCPNIEGLFIGRSAWNVDGYLDIVQRVSEILQ